MVDIHPIDLSIFILYFIALLGIGIYFFRKNESEEDYYVGGRSMSAGHIGLSVVATDVGGGFSIGLGGLGFTIGIAGSWMLLTGLIGAWLSAVFLIPKVYPIARKYNLLSFPEAIKYYFNKNVALVAGIISLIGYTGFSASQILAGAKLAVATFPTTLDINMAVLIMGVIAVTYTVFGGIKAVIYTDTVQWIILLIGLVGIGIPLGFYFIGGWEGLSNHVAKEMYSIWNLSWVDFANWAITIIPIWFVGMTLYQRIYASRDEETAVKAWKIAGLFEWPVMAFMGVLLGIFAKVAFEQGTFAELGYPPGSELDPEMGLPMFLRQMLPIGLMGLMLSAYFSAIMSTADSCLMAASGNLQSDILKHFIQKLSNKLWVSQVVTLGIGALAILLALKMTSVLDLMLYSYAFMVSGLFVPVLVMIFQDDPDSDSAMAAMILGGGTTLTLSLLGVELPFGFDNNLVGILASALTYFTFYQIKSNGRTAT